MTMDRESSGAMRVLAALIEARTGQHVSAARNWRIEAALKPVLRETGLATLETLAAQVAGGRDPALATRVVEALLNNETSFFRDSALFEQLATEALSRLADTRAESRRLRIWSAACSTGQEPWSLAMLLRDASTRWAGWTFDILASDVSASAVERAKLGRYTRFEIQRGLPVRTMLRWFREEGEEWQIDPALRRDVRFAPHDLRAPAPGEFDLILCRNVLMYFPGPVRTQVFDRLADALYPGGVLMLGAGETVIGQTDRFAVHPDLRGFYAAASDIPAVQRRVAAR